MPLWFYCGPTKVEAYCTCSLANGSGFMCHQKELITAALHDAIEEYSISAIEIELHARRGTTQRTQQAKTRANRLQHLCDTLKQALVAHCDEHGCSIPPGPGRRQMVKDSG
jgi:hypothetical protein